MFDLHQMYHRYRKYMFYLLSFYAIGWGFTGYQSVFLGLALGTALSLFNLWSMVRKQVQFGEAIQQNRKVRSLGTASRLASAGLAALLAIKFPEYLNMVSVIIGLMTVYIVIMIDYVFQHSRA
ncbi:MULTISPECIES: ATP synthase subunit I [Bacillaceae]|uniref:ATP synthase subunit n=1 Tax=Metabacillus idriensis TaxID=324768 RepID=A0A6I2M7N3_9BACI|nr:MULTISPECIES: ATP synthase subunit I [Bacillaceae]OHR65595.1 ATP synthase I [Bacillus sp. HMSC76G11]MCM3597440.1 ATP synthase subunit I [Metabacillus idriensis]MDR0138933.1 ATP synthase subunit I [Metabacillus idriensis]MRX54190.1 ATP synthase subunit [Metabacillus idriensis]TDL79057.1 ATP synthase subunit I [Peribacillus frigoritolerans]